MINIDAIPRNKIKYYLGCHDEYLIKTLIKQEMIKCIAINFLYRYSVEDCLRIRKYMKNYNYTPESLYYTNSTTKNKVYKKFVHGIIEDVRY